MKSHRSIWILLISLMSGLTASATHIVGGELTYRCLGPVGASNISYEIRLDIYQDCIGGTPQAITEDNPAFIRIFTGSGSPVLFDSIQKTSTIKVPANFSNNCVNNPPITCLNRVTFIKQYTLPVNTEGYLIAYQRCCRNNAIVNIINPGNVGATYFCVIPPAAEAAPCNNSAVFKNYPPQIICINNPLVYDHSATDSDGDSLSYELCESYVGGSPNDAKPVPSAPPYQPVNYQTFYSYDKPMGGSPVIQINPTTGILSGTPNVLGRFVVTVCCHEWRNGVNINTVKREFQFEVTNCSKAVVADIPQYSEEFNTYIIECSSFTVKFDNQSTGGFDYHWDFGIPSMQDDTSNLFSPTYTYPDTGTYFVKLVVNRGSTCPDSITRIVKIYPSFGAAFNYSGLQCPNSPIQFTDASAGSLSPNSWLWMFNDGASSTEQHPVHSFDTGGKYDVVLISKNARGCSDTASQTVEIENFRPFAGGDTVIVKGESINFNATGGIEYTWTPSTFLNAANIPNPTGFYPDTGRISYLVHIKSQFGCEGDDTLNVWVVNQASIFVPSAFSPNGDGLNDVLKPIGIGFRNINYFRVYNRWGQQMFYTTHFGEGWDGKWKGQTAEIGTYFWVLSMQNRFGREEVVKGDAILVR